MFRPRTFVLAIGIASAGYAFARHMRQGQGHHVPEGVLIGDVGMYDKATRVLLGSFYRGIADDVAAVAGADETILEVGCGPGHLALELAGRGLDVTGLDLDPAMIERARAKSHGRENEGRLSPTFDVGDASSLPYPDDSFDLVVSTLSMHHWADPAAALTEIARVLRPTGRALIWDFRSGRQFLHGHMPDLSSHVRESGLHAVAIEPWKWPLGFTPTQRMELSQALSSHQS